MRLRKIGTLLAVLAGLVVSTQTATAAPTIIGGTTATENYPFAASLQVPGQFDHYCGASLISAQWLVTAGHCAQQDASAYAVRIGSNDRTSGGTYARITEVVVHPDFDNSRLNNDIALLHLDRAASQAPVQIGSTPQPGSTVRMLGWGAENPNGQGSPRRLKQVELGVLDSERCSWWGDMTGKLCFDGKRNASACHGDSGGPAIVKSGSGWALVGATSGGQDPCGTSENIYTDVSAYSSWIGQVTGGAVRVDRH
ncbi:serine protease [Kutzneria viridogrisea]|uniref:Secreted trypsin-like serine protease n=1 Tax=Kutzneria viridogrisea TaxID=47990 RepID=A0ABR6BU30_9PSEU|nr:secreted trypsin-like serine protease [Kutzneria viridogrisea]